MKTTILPVFALAVVSVHASQTAADAPVVSAEVVEVPGPRKPIVREASVQVGFLANLTAEEKAGAGLGKLSAEQLAALDAQIAKEMKLARQGDVRGFAGTFISRRTEAERTASGLGVLTTGEKYQLDRLVSRALAATPPQPPVAIARPATEADLLQNKTSDWETHGFVQLEYGFGSGDREYKAGTVAVSQVNKKTGTAVTFAYTAMEGDGLWYCRDYSLGWRSRPFGRWSY
jgi:hypothetical protein